MAKGLAGEVGNLTNEEREAAQISPSFWRKAKREGTVFFTGKLPKQDVDELKKAIKFIRGKLNKKLKSKIAGFTSSRGKTLSGEHRKFLQQDLESENLDVLKEAVEEQQSSGVKIKAMSDAKRQRFLEFKARLITVDLQSCIYRSFTGH